MKLNIREIEYILTIMEEGSITKASQKLFIAQPSLSQVLKRVENELGVTLFTRVKNRLKLTPEGEVFIDAGQRIMKVIGELDQNFSGLSTAQSGRLVVGVPYLLGTLIATEIIPVYSCLLYTSRGHGSKIEHKQMSADCGNSQCNQ